MNKLKVNNGLLAAIFSVGLLGCAAETDESPTAVAEARSGDSGKVERIPPQLEDCGDPIAMQELMLELVNDFRSEARDCGNGIQRPADPLVWNMQLENAAIVHSDDMASENFFSHTGSDGSHPGDRMDRQGYIWLDAIENLGPDREDLADVIRFWKSSTQGHCDNLMNREVVDMGAACVFSDTADQEFYWTLKMGSS